MGKMTLTEKVQLYLRELENGRFDVVDNWLVYKKVDRYTRAAGINEGDRVGYRHKQCEGCWYCEASIDGKKIMVAMSYIMFAVHYGIENIHNGMEIRFRNSNMFDFSKENMVDSNNMYGLKEEDLIKSTTKRLQLILKKIEDRVFYVKDGELYHGATGKNAVKDTKVGCKDNEGYIQIRISNNKHMYRIRGQQIMYAYYYGLEVFDEEMVINHKDGDNSNNRKGNLEQITFVENTTYYIAGSKGGLTRKERLEFIINRINNGYYTIDLAKGYVYYNINVTSFQIGDIVGSANQYYRIGFRYKGRHYSVPLHHVIYYYSYGINKYSDKMVIDHIDNDKLNNSIYNLQQITHRQNSKKGSRVM